MAFLHPLKLQSGELEQASEALYIDPCSVLVGFARLVGAGRTKSVKRGGGAFVSLFLRVVSSTHAWHGRPAIQALPAVMLTP